jgi:hypothetical protein
VGAEKDSIGQIVKGTPTFYRSLPSASLPTLFVDEVEKELRKNIVSRVDESTVFLCRRILKFGSPT